jgi:pyruvate/2-oxoglutarate dehydrogenase complex dihydrolipoamide acyltransferase (E2) component
VKSERKKNEKYLAGPVARIAAHKLGIDLSFVSGTGPHNVIMKEDVLKS